MAVTYDTTTKNDRLSAVVTRLGAAATLEIGSAGFAAVLAVIPLANPAGSVAGGVLTFTTPQSDTDADNTGTAAVARIKDSGGTARITGLTVGVAGSGADIIMNSTAIQQHAAVSIVTAAITHA